MAHRRVQTAAQVAEGKVSTNVVSQILLRIKDQTSDHEHMWHASTSTARMKP